MLCFRILLSRRLQNICVAAKGAIRFSVRGFGCALFCFTTFAIMLDMISKMWYNILAKQTKYIQFMGVFSFLGILIPFFDDAITVMNLIKCKFRTR